ncbi:MAG: aspartyl protease family protein [Spirochaetales bacterium]|nr:aspartyl protease family protein [Spirochaetales bacterium]
MSKRSPRGIIFLACIVLFYSCAERPDRGEIEKYLRSADLDETGVTGEREKEITRARMLYHAGYFEEAKALCSELIREEETESDILFLMSELYYLYGRYTDAEALLHRILMNHSDDAANRIRAKLSLLFIYYQTNRYEEGKHLFEGEGNIILPYCELMKAFGDEKPYRIEWMREGEDKKTAVPFVFTDPLPLLQVEIGGTSIGVLIDTGGDLLIIDTDVSERLGVKPFSSITGVFGGGKKTEIELSKIDSLVIGDVVIHSVPVWILPVAQFSPMYKQSDVSIGGIIGTGVLHQFLSTIDYLNGRLILRPKSEKSVRTMFDENRNKTITEIPMYLWATHKIMAKGSLNGKNNLIFFVDSGLASEAAFIAPEQTLRYAGIPLPEMRIPDESIKGGAEGFWPIGYFHVDKLGLGGLVQYDVKGDFGTLGKETYWEDAGGLSVGFIQDGLISHQFLRQYDSWTIDFDGMKMIVTDS